MIRTILRTLVEYLDPPRVIHDRSGVSPYLSRWYLFRSQRPTMPDGSSPFNELGNPKVGVILPNVNWSLYLHRFHRSDEDGELHSHPFEWSVALILAGGYREERRVTMSYPWKIVKRDVKPWTLNFIRHDTFHRVDLLEHDAWSLFLVGPKTKSRPRSRRTIRLEQKVDSGTDQQYVTDLGQRGDTGGGGEAA